MRRIAILLLLLISLPFSVAQGKRPFTFEDMMKLKRINEPIVSPDGKWVIFSAVHVDLAQNTKIPHIWIVPIAGGESRQLTSDAGEDRPRFSPDGKWVAYISPKEGGSRIWLIGFDTATGSFTGEPRRLTSISTEADGETWSPDGKNLIFVSKVYPDCPDDACNKQRDEERAKFKVQARIYTTLFYRHWNTYFDGKRSHIFVVSVDGGAARDLTPGDYETPQFTVGGADGYDVSPDGKEVAYSSNHDPVPAASTNNEIFIVPITGGEARKISNSPGSDETPRYSPDGKWIAWRMQKRAGYESDRFRLVIYDRKSGEIKNLTEDFDRWVESYVWAAGSSKIYFSAELEGESPLFVVLVKPESRFLTNDYGLAPPDVPMLNLRRIAGGYNDNLAISPDGITLLFTRMSAQYPNEIYKIAMKDAEPVTHMNDAILSQVTMTPIESFWFTGAHGDKVQGFMVKPPNFDPGKKYALKYVVHGGPQVPIGDEWSYRWNMELFAASGYVVIELNFHGSPGYGQKFIEDISGDWGGAPFEDLMKGLDYAEQKYPFIDKDRECALGASYGGWMLDWMEGHTTRFKCMVSHDGMSNTEAAYGETEELWFPEWEFKGTPWTNREMYRKWSPILYATSFRTPMLVIHGQKDYRLDLAEGFEMFTTLQRLNVPSKMLYFPDEGHWVLKPQNSQLWYKTVGDWVDSYIGPGAKR